MNEENNNNKNLPKNQALNKSISTLVGGLYKDSSYQTQPKGTYSYALNSVNETERGDLPFLTNEGSNKPCGKFPNKNIPIGSVYVGDKNTVIFSVYPDIKYDSEIGIVDSNCNYKTIMRGDLNFKEEYQIDAVFRLVRGCERVVYWVDNYNKPRFFNLDTPDNFRLSSIGDFVASKFDLIKNYEKVPKFEKIQVLDTGGKLKPGSYNISIQYLDYNLNPTEWITTSEIINIYNDSINDSYLEVRGSISSKKDYEKFGETSKSIRIELSNLDTNFLFYRLAFIEANNGTGEVININYTDNISIKTNFFIYNGYNFIAKGTTKDLLAVNSVISSAGSIEQLENMLILANTKGKKTNLCELQKYASKITADAVIKKVNANTIIDGNTKSPTVHFEGVGYMPGEIYSFGIVYLFEDSTLSPVYHIPGKSHKSSPNKVFTTVDGSTFPMDPNNGSKSNKYSSRGICFNYWGVDSTGFKLENEYVRHHRFPTRKSTNVNLVEKISSSSTQYNRVRAIMTITGDLRVPCTQEQINKGLCTTVSTTVSDKPFNVEVRYRVNGKFESFTYAINPNDYVGKADKTTNLFKIAFTIRSKYFYAKVQDITLEGIFEENNINLVSTPTNQVGDFSIKSTVFGDITYTFKKEVNSIEESDESYNTPIFGIKFSNIELPPSSVLNGEKVVGYYIVRNERKEEDKTILDSCVIANTIENIKTKYIAHGLLNIESPGKLHRTENDDKPVNISKRVFAIINPEFKFNNIKYNKDLDFVYEGAFEERLIYKSKFRYRDVYGKSYDDKNVLIKDSDGWSLKTITRDTIVDYKKTVSSQDLNKSNIEDLFYLNSLQSKDIIDSDKKLKAIYNISADNKIGIIRTKSDFPFPTGPNGKTVRFIYGYLKRDLSDPYSTFRNREYIKVSLNPSSNKTITVYNGDTYVTPMRYVNTVKWDDKVAKRGRKSGVLGIILGVLAFAFGVIAAIPSLGASLGISVAAAVAIAASGVLLAYSGIKKEELTKAYYEEYDKGLRETALDKWVAEEYFYKRYNKASTPGDDEIQWIGDCVTNFWFESQVNTSLRYGLSTGITSFLDAPGMVEQGNNDPERQIEVVNKLFGFIETGTAITYLDDILIEPTTLLDKHLASKLLVLDLDKKDSRAFIGSVLSEWYEVNPDYRRLNKQKLYFHLGLEYDCCSNCREVFPHRVHYSQQSFQEELTDNYSVFLPNNYRDIEGESGEITDLFRIKSNLFIHTEDALWHLPQQYQKDVVNDIVSFIGTGSFFSVPPRKILDENKSSGGSQHKWSTIKTKHGVFFISERERKIYMFNEKGLQVISNIGLNKWFRENIKLKLPIEYFTTSGYNYNYDNNPSGKYGIGFISTYDTNNERVIFTKKDFTLSEEVKKERGYLIVNCGQTSKIFKNFASIIALQKKAGWVYLGVENCKLKFEKLTIVGDKYTREYKYIDGTVLNPNTYTDQSWTISFSLKHNKWLSFHSYTPNFYYYIAENFYSWKENIVFNNGNYLWEHNVLGNYQKFYNEKHPFVVEYVSVSSTLQTKIWEDIMLITEAKKYNKELNSYVDERFKTFNKAIFYNARQCTGELNLKVKGNNEEDYMINQVINTDPTIALIDRNERNWTINNIRDIRIDYTQPIFNELNIGSVDKVLNTKTLDNNKNWEDLATLRDKYLVIRLIFDKFEDVKLIINYSIESKTTSFR